MFTQMNCRVNNDLEKEFAFGEEIEAGCERTTRLTSTGTVIKHAYNKYGPECNKREVDVWLIVKDTELAKCFVPILSWSDDYKYIEMPFAEDISASYVEVANPLKPKFIGDLSYFNWGLHEGLCKIRDYEDISAYDITEEVILDRSNWKDFNG